jgi:hypothetical protein
VLLREGVLRAGSGARTRAGDTFAATVLSLSDKAKSCLMIAAFSDLLAFSGAWVNTFTIRAHTTNAAATPIRGMLII